MASQKLYRNTLICHRTNEFTVVEHRLTITNRTDELICELTEGRAR